MIIENIAKILSIQFIILIIFFLLNFNYLRNIFKRIKLITWLFLILIILISQLVFLLAPAFIFMEDLTVANEFYSGGDYFVKNTRYGPFYPYLLYLSFLIFTPNDFSVNFFESMFIILCILGIFLLSYLITKKESFAIISSAMYLLLIFTIFRYQNDRLYLGIYHFWFLFFMLFSLLSYKVNNWKAYSLVLLVIYFSGITRFEMMSFLYIFIFGLFLYRWKDFRSLRNFKILSGKMLVPLLVFLAFSVVYFIYLDYSVHRWREYELSDFGRIISEIVIWPTIGYFSSYDINRSMEGLFNFLNSPLVLLFSISVIIGIYFMFKNHKKISIFLISAFIILLPPYISCGTCFNPRYFLYLIIPLIIFACFSFYQLAILSKPIGKYVPQKLITKFKLKRKYFAGYAFIFFIFFSLVYLIPFTKNGSVIDILLKKNTDNELYEIAKTINNISGKGENEDVLVIISEYMYFDQIRFFTLKKTFPLIDIIRSTQVYRKNLEAAKPKKEVIAGAGTLFYNRSAMVEAQDAAKLILETTITQMQEEYKRGEDPLNIKSRKEIKIYFLKSSGCDNYMGSYACDLITDNFHLNLLTETRNYRLYSVVV